MQGAVHFVRNQYTSGQIRWILTLIGSMKTLYIEFVTFNNGNVECVLMYNFTIQT